VVFVLISAGLSYAQQEVNNCYNYFQAGDYQRAISSGENAVRLYPRNEFAHFCLGQSYYNAGELDKAL